MRSITTWSLVLLSAAACSEPEPELGAVEAATTGPGCPALSNSPHWGRDRTIKYYLDPAITGAQRTQIVEAFKRWSDARYVNGSGVRFVGTTDSAVAHYRLNNLTQNTCAVGGITTVLSSTQAYTAFNTTDCTVQGRGYDVNVPGHETYWLKVALHEIGHTMGLGHPSGGGDCTIEPDGYTVMNHACSPNDVGGNMPTTPTGFCDIATLSTEVFPPPEPPPGHEPECGEKPWAREATTSQLTCTCPGCPGSPIVIDVDGDGFDLTDAAGGVRFDLFADRQPRQIGWTSKLDDDAWLALDRDGDGAIDDGAELFGDSTPQPDSDHRNGFLALAGYDQAADGSRDGWISDADAIYPALRLWQDRNHDGQSQAAELSPLAALGVEAISLDYRISRKRDRHGNEFRYGARVAGAPGAPVGRTAFDVFVVVDD